MDVAQARAVLTLDDSQYQKGIKQAARAFDGMGKEVTASGKAASARVAVVLGSIGAAAATALAAGAAMAVKSAADLQQSVASIASIKPEIDTSKVFAQLNELQARVPQTSAQLASSLYDVFSSINVSQAEGLKLVEQFAKGATGAQTDAQTFGTAVIGVMNAYKTSVGEAGHIQDLFFNTVKAGVVTGGQLAGSLGPVTQAAKSAGQSMETLFAGIAAVTKEGGDAAQNINNLNNTFAKLGTEEAQKAFKALKIDVFDSSRNFKQITDIATEFQAKMKGLSQEARTNIISKIFPDAQARQGFQTLLSQLDFAKQQLKENATSAGSAEAAYKKLSATFETQMKLLQGGFRAIITTIGAELLPLITPFIKRFAEEMPAAIARVREAFSGVGGAVSTFGQHLATIRDTALRIVGPVREFIVQQFGVVRQWFVTNMPLIQQTVQTVLRTISELWQRHGATILAIVEPIWEGIKTVISTAINAVLGIIRTIMQVINGDWSGAWESLKGVVSNVWEGLVGVVKNAATALLNAGQLVISAVFDLGERIGNAIWDGITGKAKQRQAAAVRQARQLTEATVKNSVPQPGHGMGDLKAAEYQQEQADARARAAAQRAAAAAGQQQEAARRAADAQRRASQAPVDLGRSAQVMRDFGAAVGTREAKKTPAQQQYEQAQERIAANTRMLQLLHAGASLEVAKLGAEYRLLTKAQLENLVVSQVKASREVAAAEATDRARQELAKVRAATRDLTNDTGKNAQVTNQFADAEKGVVDALKQATAWYENLKAQQKERIRIQKEETQVSQTAARRMQELQRDLAIEQAKQKYGEFSPQVVALTELHTEYAKGTPVMQAWARALAATLQDADLPARAKRFHEQQREQLKAQTEALTFYAAGIGQVSQPQLEQIEQTQREMADAARSRQKELDDQMTDGAKALTARLHEEAGRQREAVESVAQGLNNVFGNAFLNLQHGFSSFFQSIAAGFQQMLQQMAAEYLASQLVRMVGRAFGLGVGNAGNSLVGTLFGQQPAARAMGGPVRGGQQYLVGENGPEIFRPGRSGAIIPNQQMAAAGPTINQTFNIQAMDAESFRRDRRAIMADGFNEARRQSRRDGY